MSKEKCCFLCRSRVLSSSSLNADAHTRDHDPENKLLWKMNSKRMDAQAVRDSLLHAAGELDLTRGGPSIPVSDEASRRRSLYFVHSHNEHQKFLSMFDDASVLECYRRAESIVPQQALALENSDLAAGMAQRIATKLLAADRHAYDGQFVATAWQCVLGTTPSDEEVQTATAALKEFQSFRAGSDDDASQTAACALLVLSLLNHNDFVTIR